VTAESKEKKTDSLQIVLVVLVLVSMVLNVYLFRNYAKQDDAIEAIASWEASNEQIQKDLSSVTTMLTDAETRQSTQESVTKEVLQLLESQPWVEQLSTITDALTVIEARQLEAASAPVLEPDWVDKETWSSANSQILEALTLMQVMLTDLEEVQSAQDTVTTGILETLAAMDARQAAEALEPAVEPNWVDKESWEAANQEIQSDLSQVTAMLLGLETRITDSLAMVEERQAAEALEPAAEPNWVDKESWEAVNQEIQSDLSRVTAMLLGLETRITDSLAMFEERQAAESSEPAVEPNWVDKESWEAANQEIQSDLSQVTAMLLGLETRITEALAMVEERQAAESSEPEDALTQEELQAIKEMLMEIIAKTDKAEALNSEPESEPMASVQVMAPVAQVVEHECGIVEVRLLRGDSVWNIVARFKSPPSPALVNEVVEYNDIKDPRRLPVGFPVRIPMELVNGNAGF
jgi:predicted transcriptional regulator with HTH domain